MSKKVKNKEWSIRHSRKLQRKKYHRHANRRKGTGAARGQLEQQRNYNIYQHINICKKSTPEIFSFIENPAETIGYFDDILSEIRNKIFKNTFEIDSSNIKRVTVDALIYLISIMENIKINQEMQYMFKGNLPDDVIAARIYQECGFMTYVKSRVRKLPPSTDKMCIISGTRNDPNVTKQLCQFVMRKLTRERKDIIPLQKVLIELMSNVYHHAYNAKEDIMKKNWYIYAEYADSHVRFIFLDTGAGIARTVRKNFFEKLQRLSKYTSSDSELMHSALKGEYRTETKAKYRGNGLSGVREMAEKPMFRGFTVISGSGQCQLTEDNRIIKTEFMSKIYGTIYIFDIV